MPPGAVLDANVLMSAPIRDALLRAAEAALYRPVWSATILDEVRRNIIEHRRVDPAQAEYLIDRLKAAFPEAEIFDYESLGASLTNDPKDRHVLAAAVTARAHVIVTSNVRHFPDESLSVWRIVAQSPDQFLAPPGFDVALYGPEVAPHQLFVASSNGVASELKTP
ncbi:MAG TPA: PIN domain-containing protein [Chloroflexota bacterium]|nr:PIN domain-containing protein [Chloroflexota bacterium]